MKEGNNSTNEWEEEQYLALFIDILGISDRLKEAKERSSKLKSIGNNVKRFYTYIHKNFERGDAEISEAKVLTFSDSVYISIPTKLSCPKEDNSYFRIRSILNNIGIAQAELILSKNRKKIFLRGGVGLGYRVYDGKDVEVSKAYYESYRMEQEAIYPIIKLTKEMTDQLGYFDGYKDFECDDKESMPHKKLVMETWGATGEKIYFLNYLKCYIEDGTEEDIDTILSEHKQAIITAYEKVLKSKKRKIVKKKIALKYAFLAHRYHNVFLINEIGDDNYVIKKDEIPSFDSLYKEVKELEIKEKMRQFSKEQKLINKLSSKNDGK